ncbi:MAG: hypothetical protein P4L67_03330 [Candidatus Pacebacteria bacterium]|nr:hypothetical protein [Candidatus Paceibacterota bacterium]
MYNWRVLNCLKLWAQSIWTYSETDLKLLVSPFTELSFGILKLQSMNTRYLPFHLKVIEILNELSAHTGTYIPSCTFCIEILGMPELQKPAKGNDDKLFEYELAVKMPKSQQRSIEGLHLVMIHAINLIVGFCAAHAGSVYLPELAVPIIRSLGKVKKMIFVSEIVT